MTPEQFYASRQEDWQQLSDLLDATGRQRQRVTPGQVEDIGRLYRRATSDLALAQRDFPNHRVTDYLNELVARAHATVYRGEPLALKRLTRFFTTGLPRTFRQTWPFTLVALLLFVVPALAAGVATAIQPQTARWLLPAGSQGIISHIDSLQPGDEWSGITSADSPLASSVIMTNNIRVSFLAFAGGMLAGIATVYVLIFNGLLIGVVTGLTINRGIGLVLWNFVIGHGVIELSMIFFAGGAGLMVGWAIIHPGHLRRRDALAQAARTALRLVIGCATFLVLAGLIEGFISPSLAVPAPVKWLIGIGSGVILYSYLLLGGRQRRRRARF